MAAPHALKRQVVEYVKENPVDAVRRVTDGAVNLVKCMGKYWESSVMHGLGGASGRGQRLLFYPNPGKRMPGFVWGRDRGTFIYLVQLAQTLEEEEAWRLCAKLLPLHDMAPGQAAEWTLSFALEQQKTGLRQHARMAAQVAGKFRSHVAQLEEEVRLRYPLLGEGRSILATYYDLAGNPTWIQEREIEPHPDKGYRNWPRWIKRVAAGAKPKAVGGLYPKLPEYAWKPVAVITVEAWEADQLCALHADAFAVPTHRMPVPDDMLLALARSHSRILFLGPSGSKWAQQRVGQCRRLKIPAEAFVWPEGVPAGYTVSRVLREGGKVRVDADGAVSIECPPAVLRPARQERKTYVMISSLVARAPAAAISPTAKVVYAYLLDIQGSNGHGVHVEYDDLQEVSGASRKGVMEALKQLRQWSLIVRVRRGYYQVCTRTQIPPATLLQLESARQEWEEARQTAKNKTAARVLDIAAGHVDEEQDEAFF